MCIRLPAAEIYGYISQLYAYTSRSEQLNILNLATFFFDESINHECHKKIKKSTFLCTTNLVVLTKDTNLLEGDATYCFPTTVRESNNKSFLLNS